MAWNLYVLMLSCCFCGPGWGFDAGTGCDSISLWCEASISDFFVALHTRLLTSLGSSTVSKSFDQPLNWWSFFPTMVEQFLSRSRVKSVCICSLARACHSARQKSSIKRRELYGSSRRLSTTGIKFYSQSGQIIYKWKGDAPGEYPRNLELLASLSQTHYLQIFIWCPPQMLEVAKIWGKVSTVRPDGKCYTNTYRSSNVSTSCTFLVLPAA